MTEKDVLELYGNFNFDFNGRFLIETEVGNFIWDDPEYGGDNTIVPFNGTLKDYIAKVHIPYVRDKGNHVIKDYCGENVRVLL